jgi:hypothetical protein
MKPLNLPVGLALVIGMAGTFFLYLLMQEMQGQMDGALIISLRK